jgi:hypothetical protein
MKTTGITEQTVVSSMAGKYRIMDNTTDCYGSKVDVLSSMTAVSTTVNVTLMCRKGKAFPLQAWTGP